MTAIPQPEPARSAHDAPASGSSVLLRFRELQKAFGGNIVLNGISGEIRPGEVILLRGDNGSGKTTLLNILTGFLEPDAGIVETTGRPKGPQGCRSTSAASRTWQDVRLFPSLDLAENIAAADPATSVSPWMALFRPRRTRRQAQAARKAASETLASLGLTGRDTSSADRISLGQSKRVAIARALQTRAPILFLDEPLAGLDADGIRDVLGHLRDLAARRSVALVIVEHALHLPRILDFATTVWTLSHGNLTVESPAAVRQEPATSRHATGIHSLIRQALDCEVPVTTQSLPQGARLTTYWLTGHPAASAATPPVLEVKNLTLRRGPRLLFADPTSPASGLTFSLHPQTINVLEAPNGWGKSSLLDRIIGLIPSESGTATGLNQGGAQASENPSLLLSSSQLFPGLTVAEICRISRKPMSGSIESLRQVASLSGGERRRLAIHCLPSAQLQIMDEFFQGLDAKASAAIFATQVKRCSTACQLYLEPDSLAEDSRTGRLLNP